MTVDKRFWTGAIVVVTVAVAGASALPALLLARATPESMPLAIVAVTANPAAPQAPEPFRDVAAERPAPVPVPAEPQRQAETAPVPQPVPAVPVTVAAAPQVPPAAQPAPAAPPVVAPPQEAVSAAASAQSFPPVQPIGVAAARTEDAPAVAPEISRPVSATAKPARAARVREARASHGAKPKRIRPVAYPIREFLAWRR